MKVKVTEKVVTYCDHWVEVESIEQAQALYEQGHLEWDWDYDTDYTDVLGVEYTIEASP